MTEFTYYHRYFCLRIVTVEKKSKTVYPEEDEQDSDDENDAQIKSDKAVITNTTNGKLLSDIIPQIWKDFNNIMWVTLYCEILLTNQPNMFILFSLRLQTPA